MSHLPKGEFADLDNGMQLHYLDLPAQGEAFAGNLLLIHGSGPGASGWSNYQFNAEAMQQAGYRVLIPDLPGYGFSGKPQDVEYTLDYFIDCMARWIDLLGLGQCALVGNSLGGAIAIGYALKNPARVSKLILMAPGGLEEREVYFATEGIQAMVKYPMGSPEFTRDVLQKLLGLLVFDAKHVTDTLVSQRWEILQQQNPQVLASMKVPNLADRLGELQCPILVLWGREDKFCPISGAQTLVNNASNTRVNMLTECGHWVMVEYPDYFNRQCLDFLQHP